MICFLGFNASLESEISQVENQVFGILGNLNNLTVGECIIILTLDSTIGTVQSYNSYRTEMYLWLHSISDHKRTADVN